MSERAYTVKEVDAMRSSVRDLLTSYTAWGSTPLPEGFVEDRLRTYMLANIEPADLAEQAAAHLAQQNAACAEQRKMLASILPGEKSSIPCPPRSRWTRTRERLIEWQIAGIQ